jgi:hypothetical protein
MSEPALCIVASCSNRGNAAKGGRCNSCASGKPPTPASTSSFTEAPYPADVQAIVDASSGARSAAMLLLGSIESFPPMHSISPWLYIGDERAAGVLTPLAVREGETNAAALAALRSHKVGAVVCVSGAKASHRPFESQGIAYASALLSDGCPHSKRASEDLFPVLLARAIPLVRAAREAGSAVLVHCNAGINRSCSTACAILMVLEPSLTLAQAYAQVVAARPICQPSFHAYLSSPAFAALAAHLRSAPPPPSALQAAQAAVWSCPAPWLPPSHPPHPPSLQARRQALYDATYKNPLLGLALLQHGQRCVEAGQPAPPCAPHCTPWDEVHFFDDSAKNCSSARCLLPSSNVHEIEPGGGQAACLQGELRGLAALTRPGLMCFDWGGTLGDSSGDKLAGGETTAALLQDLCSRGWVFACVSNDPNDAITVYSAGLAAAGAPPFAILANGERIHQVRLGAALAGVGGGGGEARARVARVLQCELGGGSAAASGAAPSASGGGGGSGGSSSGGSGVSGPLELALLEWAYFYAQTLPSSFFSTLGLKRGEAVTAGSLGNPALPEDLAGAIAALMHESIPGYPSI